MAGVRAVLKSDTIDMISIKNPPNEPGVAYRIFSSLAEGGVDVDLILQTASQNKGSDIIFTVQKSCTEKAGAILDGIFAAYPDTVVGVDCEVVKLTVSGEGMQGRPGVAAVVFRALWNAGVHIINISTSEIRISMLVDRAEGDTAFAALTEAFEIEL